MVRAAVVPSVIVEGEPAEPRVNVVPAIMLLVSVRLAVVQKIGPLSVRSYGSAFVLTVLKPLVKLKALAMVRLAPTGCKIGTRPLAPVVVLFGMIVPVPNGPDVIAPGLPT